VIKEFTIKKIFLLVEHCVRLQVILNISILRVSDMHRQLLFRGLLPDQNKTIVYSIFTGTLSFEGDVTCSCCFFSRCEGQL